MKKIYPAAFLFILFSSCFPHVRVHYVGDKKIQTEKVDIYVDESAIKKGFSIIGKGYAEITNNRRRKLFKEKILEEAVNKAQKNGADAVFFKESFIYSPGTNINTRSFTDSVGKSIFTNSNTSVTPTIGYFHSEILFLKYR